MQAIVITTSGEVTETELDGLEAMQAIVGGLIERVECDGFEIWVNEEGLIYDLDVNTAAADIGGLGGRVDLLMYGVRGDVFITALDMEDVTDSIRRTVNRVMRERI